MIRTEIPMVVPETMRKRLAGRKVSFKVPAPVAIRMRTPEKMRPSKWVELHRAVVEGPHRGPWRAEFAPHLPQILDTFATPHVREIFFAGTEQAGKSNAMYSCLAWAVANAPGNAFLCLPTEHDSAKTMNMRLQPMLRQSPQLARLLSARADDTSQARINFKHGMSLLAAWANSPASMAAFPARYIFGDEIDKWPLLSGRETDPITLLRRRVRTYRSRAKLFFASTPAQGHIYRGLQSCDQIHRWWCRCPECSTLIDLIPEGLSMPENATPEQVGQGGCCGYACSACGTVWGDVEREQAIRAGQWVVIKGADVERPSKVGFHLTALACLDVPLHEVCTAYLRTQDRSDLAARITWSNSYLAEDHQQDTAEAPELGDLQDRAEDLGGVIPMDAGVLTAGVDVQADRLELEVTGWGVGAESWAVEFAVLFGDTSLPEVWQQLDAFLIRRWRHESGVELPITRTLVDAGYRTDQVYKFTGPRLGRGIFAAKGVADPQAPEFRGPHKMVVGSTRIRHFLLGTQRLKSLMFGYLGLVTPGHGYAHINADYPEEWFTQIRSEHLVTRRVGGREVSSWEKKSSKARNEAVDCRAYALAAFLSLPAANIKATVAELRRRSTTATAAAITGGTPTPPPRHLQPPRRSGSNFATSWR